MVVLTGILSCIFSMISAIVSPMPTFYTIWTLGRTGKFQITPYIASVLNAMLGIYFYIVSKEEILYLMTNVVGCIAGGFYLAIYVVYATAQQKDLMMAEVCIFNLLVPSIVILGTNFLHARVLVVKWMYGASSVFLYAAPFMILVEVVESQSIEYMPFVLSSLTLVRGVASVADATVAHDTIGIILHSIGCGFASAQLIIYYYVKKHASTRTTTTEVEPQGEGEGGGAEAQGEGEAGA